MAISTVNGGSRCRPGARASTDSSRTPPSSADRWSRAAPLRSSAFVESFNGKSVPASLNILSGPKCASPWTQIQKLPQRQCWVKRSHREQSGSELHKFRGTAIHLRHRRRETQSGIRPPWRSAGESRREGRWRRFLDPKRQTGWSPCVQPRYVARFSAPSAKTPDGEGVRSSREHLQRLPQIQDRPSPLQERDRGHPGPHGPTFRLPSLLLPSKFPVLEALSRKVLVVSV